MVPLTLGPPKARPPEGASLVPGVGAVTLVPPWLPGRHFGAAMLCYALGAAGLVFIAPDLAHRNFFLPRVVAVVHLFTLGWITLSIFGALCQFLPVAIGRGVRSVALANASFVAQTLGVVGLVAGLSLSSRPLLLSGAFALAAAFATFSMNLIATLLPVKERNVTYWALAGASVALLTTPAYGVVLAFNLHDGVLGDRFSTVGQHAHIALLGFVMLVIVGVAHRLLPMFLLSHGASERPAWAAVALLSGSATSLALPVGGAPRLTLAGALGCAGTVALIAQAALFFKHRKRSAIDPGMRLAGSGLVGLAIAVVLAPLSLTRGMGDPRLLTAYFMVLLGAVTLFVAGHYYKIVPFLVWNHRFGPLLGKRKVPRVVELYSERVAHVDVALLVSGLLGLVIATYLGAAAVARAAALVFAAGAWLQVVVIARVAQKRVA